MIYISGPMTGYDDLNYPAFDYAARELRFNCENVISPHEINSLDNTDSYAECLRKRLFALLLCDTIYMLDGWCGSKGATLEHHIAITLGMRRLFQERTNNHVMQSNSER